MRAIQTDPTAASLTTRKTSELNTANLLMGTDCQLHSPGYLQAMPLSPRWSKGLDDIRRSRVRHASHPTLQTQRGAGLHGRDHRFPSYPNRNNSAVPRPASRRRGLVGSGWGASPEFMSPQNTMGRARVYQVTRPVGGRRWWRHPSSRSRHYLTPRGSQCGCLE